jgi:hypothetical protein
MISIAIFLANSFLPTLAVKKKILTALFLYVIIYIEKEKEGE